MRKFSIVTVALVATLIAGTASAVTIDFDSVPLSGRGLNSGARNPGPGAFKASISGGFSSFSIGMGDLGADEDEGHLEAYDANDNLLVS